MEPDLPADVDAGDDPTFRQVVYPIGSHTEELCRFLRQKQFCAFKLLALVGPVVLGTLASAILVLSNVDVSRIIMCEALRIVNMELILSSVLCGAVCMLKLECGAEETKGSSCSCPW